MPLGVLESGQVDIRYQYTSAKGTPRELTHDPAKEFMFYGKAFTFVIRPADEKTHDWVAARFTAIHANFVDQEDTLQRKCDEAQAQFSDAHIQAKKAMGLQVSMMRSRFVSITLPAVRMEDLLHPEILACPIRIKSANMIEQYNHSDGTPPTFKKFAINVVYPADKQAS